jgi:hypothetical protein
MSDRGQGYTIGHRKTDHFPAVTTQGVRLQILSSVGPTHIREFQPFDQATASAVQPKK